jgi:glucuronate isomerase
MTDDRLAEDLYTDICRIPLIDCHSHIDPRQPTSSDLADILGYHYLTELAHSTAMDKAALASDLPPRDRAWAIFSQMANFDNTVPYHWFLEIARAFFNFQAEALAPEHFSWLWDHSKRLLATPDWEKQVLRRTNLEKIFLTSPFDDPLQGFDTKRYVPCLRADDLVFGLNEAQIRKRLAETSGVELQDADSLRTGLGKLFDRFVANGAKACFVSLPAEFRPEPVEIESFSRVLSKEAFGERHESALCSLGVFWMLVELCRDFQLPVNLMIGASRGTYPGGVYQGQDLFDQRWSLSQYGRLFNAFPNVTFCVSVIGGGQNHELASYSWVFPNVMTCGHWWYSNVPVHMERDLRARLEAVPKTKQVGYFSDAHQLEFTLPKYNMYRRVLARVLADDFVRKRIYTEHQAIVVSRMLLHDNARRIYKI